VGLNITKKDLKYAGEVLCHRDEVQVPVSELFEAEVETLKLPIMPITIGYQCQIHLHTVSDSITIN
jgi:hypothetical protein